MRLTLEWLDGRTLDVRLDELRALVDGDARLRDVELDLAEPGESCRIARVFDVIAPRAKVDGGEDFPGVLGRMTRAGEGRTRALENVAVVVTDQETPKAAALSVIDMSGPAADMSPFSATRNVVVSASPAEGVGRGEYCAAIRLAGLKIAVALARASGDRVPDRVEVFDLPAPARVPATLANLPRVAYVFQIHSHQRPTGVDEGILYGDPIRRMLPTLVHPNEILDGAVVRGFMTRNTTTYAIQNHPMIRALYAQHGETLAFVGVVLTVAQATEPERVRSAALAAGIVTDVLGADAAVFTKIGGGAPHVDMAQAAAACEARGVKTSLIVEDMSTDGSSDGMLLFNFPGVDTLVNVGSSQMPLTLPRVARVLGAGDLAAAFAGEVATNYTGVCGAIDQTGASRVVAVVE